MFAKIIKMDEAVLDDDGYHLRDAWTKETRFEILGIYQIDPRVRAAAVTNRLLGITRNSDFKIELGKHFQNTSILGRRWRIIEAALESHVQRGYLLSIPTLLAQVEGMLADALVINQIVYIKNGKVYAQQSGGRKRKELKGMYALANAVTNSAMQKNPSL
jgi:hypothetical protein